MRSNTSTGARGHNICVYLSFNIARDAKSLAAKKNKSFSELVTAAIAKEIARDRGGIYDPEGDGLCFVDKP